VSATSHRVGAAAAPYDGGVPPSRDYLAKLGELAYLVSHLEWEVIGDIRIAATDVDAVKLLGLSTGTIARTLEQAALTLKDRPNVHHFVSTSAKALLDVADRRNGVLHARPGTAPSGDEQLLRLREGKDGKPERFWIDQDHLDRQIAAVRYWIDRVEAARLHPLD
jgi:hypothetical protein